MKRCKPIRNFIRRLRRDQRGAVALTFLATSTVMLGGAFGAIDLVRYNVAQGRLQNALDAAVISAGRNLPAHHTQDERIEDDAWMGHARGFFSSNMPNGYMGSSVSSDDLVIDYREDFPSGYLTGQFVTMSVGGDLPLISTGFMKIASVGLAASNEAVRRTRNDMEVVLALDNSGSMNEDSPTRMSVLKEAATNLTGTVLGASNVPGGSQRVYIGLVPFTDVVNVRNYALDGGWLDYPAVQSNYVHHLWDGCVVEPKGNWSNSNRLPAQALTPSAGFQPLHLTYARDYSIGSGRRLVGDPVAFNGLNINYDRRISASRHSDTVVRVKNAVDADYCLQGRVRFLNNQQENIESAIDEMTAYGGTGVPVGLLWAWRMLHPAWRGAWGEADMPRDPDAGTLSKVIVLLTDGENAPVRDGRRLAGTSASDDRRYRFEVVYNYQACNRTNWSGNCTQWSSNVQEGSFEINDVAEDYTTSWFGTRSYYGQCPATGLRMMDPMAATPSDYTTSTSCSNNSIGYGNSSIQGTTAFNAYMAQLCQNVKNDGNEIKIYTITLAQGDDESTAKTLMRNCASGPSYYFDAQNVDDLPAVFASIAGALTELRLTQ